MALEAGTRLGDYEILSPIGAGGMGEVYKARDVRLDRTVAIKVLPAHLSENVQLRQRFEQEARAVSSLNHPNICTLHDIGRAQGIDFMVMEYIEGETLAERIARGAIPLEEAIEIGLRVADALDKAHRNEIVHRDVKPGNIILTKSGPKLLDFGLAKRGVNASGESDASAVTEQKPLTEEGAILGTFQYMAPEQVEGLDTDARTDIFALGALLYEMLTGRKAFEGKSQASLISAILSSEPRPIAELRPMTPIRVGRIVRRCLAKDPDNRWQSARDIVLELSSLNDDIDAPPPIATASRVGERFLWALALLAAVSAGVLLRGSGVAETTRLSVSLPAGHQLMSGGGGFGLLASFDISPDGRNIVYAEGSELASQLYLRRVGDFEAVAIPGTEGATMPFFSPDGKWVVYRDPGRGLLKVALAGGVPAKILDSFIGRGASWGSDGTIVVVVGSTQLTRVSEDGGVPEPIVEAEPDSVFYSPQILPGNMEVLVTLARRDRDRVVVVSLETGAVHTVLEGYRGARYVSSGHLIVSDPGTENLLAVRFDLGRLEAHGAPVVVVENVYASPRSGIAQFAVSETGTLVYAPSAQGGHALVWVDREGHATEAWEPERGHHTHPRVSPDGQRLAVDYFADGYRDIWVYDLSRGSRTRLTSVGGAESSGPGTRLPGWMPGGKRVSFFFASPDGASGLYTRAADGSDEAESSLAGSGLYPLSWSPDGSTLLFSESQASRGNDILTLSDGGDPTPFLSSPFNEVAPIFSPNGRYIAYGSDESGRQEVYVQPYPAGDQKWTISTDGGQEPLWSRDGRELFYRTGYRMMVVDVRLSPGFEAGRPRLLFEEAYPTDASHRAYDIAPDGQRFLMIQDNDADRT